jgi:hypothetical protein
MKKAKKITQAMTDCYATIENEMKKNADRRATESD